jgi:hypothetical protein
LIKHLDWLVVCLTAVCWLWLGSAATAVAQQPEGTVTLEAYRTLLAQSRALVEQDDTLGELAALADEWEAITAVELTREDGQTIILPVQHTYLTTMLRAASPDLGLLRRTLIALDEASATWPAAPPVTAAEYAPDQAALDTVLARPEFQVTPTEPNLIEQVRQRIAAFINDVVLDFFLFDTGLDGADFLLTVVLPLLTGIALVVVIVLAIRRLRSDFVRQTAVDEKAWQTGEQLTAATAYQQAQTTSGAGDYRTAVRYLYLSTLLALDERDILRYDRAATNREYLRRVAHQPDLYRLLQDVVDVFDRVWYGFQPIGRETYDTYAERVAALQRQRRRRESGPEQDKGSTP